MEDPFEQPEKIGHPEPAARQDRDYYQAVHTQQQRVLAHHHLLVDHQHALLEHHRLVQDRYHAVQNHLATPLARQQAMHEFHHAVQEHHCLVQEHLRLLQEHDQLRQTLQQRDNHPQHQ
jgi:hypothetical protein